MQQPIYYSGQPQQPFHQNQQPNVIIVQQAPSAPVPSGRFGAQFKPGATKRCGDLMISMGFFMLIGAGLETAGLALLYDASYRVLVADYSLIYYAGYWCGALIMASGSVATHSATNISDCMIIADLVSAAVGITFAIVGFALPAGKMSDAISLNDGCNSYYYYNYCTETALLLSGYSVMIGTGVLAALAAAILVVFTIITIIRGCTRPRVDPQQNAAPVMMAQPIYQQPPPQPQPQYYSTAVPSVQSVPQEAEPV